MSNKHGVGIEGRVGIAAATELVALAERLGYGSFWFNVMGKQPDPIEMLAAVVDATSTIEIGIGLFPLDAWPAAELAPRLRDIGASTPRIVLGIASGQIREHVVALNRDAIAALRAAVPECRIATGGYGPLMLKLGGREADAVIANWMTPERLGWLIDRVAEGAEEGGRPPPPIYLYHRAAAGSDAAARLKAELAEYRKYPVHQKHQESMGNPDMIGVAAAARGDIDAQLAPYVGQARIVLKPLTHDMTDVDEWRSVLRFFAP